MLRSVVLTTGVESVEVRMNADLPALDGVAYHTVDPDAGSTTVYTVPVGSDERYLDFRFTAISSEVEREQNWPSKYAVYHADGDFYRMDLENLSGVKAYDTDDESFYKEFYVPLFVETQYVNGKAYTKEYTLHVIRTVGDNSLRAIDILPLDTTLEQLYDNNEDATKVDGSARDGILLNGDSKGGTVKVMDNYTDDDGITVYRAYIDRSIDQFDVTVKASYMTSILALAENAAAVIKDSDTWYQRIQVNMTDEKTRINIAVRAGEGVANDDAQYALEIFRVDDDASLKLVASDHNNGTLVVHNEVTEKDENNIYHLYLSTSEVDAADNRLVIRDLDLTAVANKLAAQVDLASVQYPAVTAGGKGEAKITLPTVKDLDEVTVRVTPSIALTGSTVVATEYKVVFHLVNLELSVIKVNNDDKIKLTAMAGTGNQTIYTTTVDPNTASLDEVLLQVADIANADMTVTVVPGTITLPGTTSNVKTYTGKEDRKSVV